jgi:hypothetical protein
MSIIASGTTSGTALVSTGNTNGNLVFQTNGTTTALTLATDQLATFAGKASFPSTIGVGGATAAASGSGVSFPATQSASSDANTLDDYEEGTFTPVITGSVSGTVSGTGVYTKIGNLVYVCTSYNVITGSAPVGTYSITGLPFASSSSIDIYPFSMAAFFAFGFDSSKILNAFVIGGTSVISLAESVNNSASTDITAANFTAGSIYFRVSGSYRT